MRETIALKHPVPLEVGHLIEVQVRRIRVRDRIALEAGLRLNGSDLEGSVALVAENTGLDVPIVTELDDEDFAAIVEKITVISGQQDPALEPVGSEE